MSPRRIFIIFRKELRDTLRDRRTLIMMIVLPLVLVPALVVGAASLAMSQQKKAEQQRLRIALLDDANAPALRAMLEAREDLTLVEGIPRDSLQSLVRRDSLDAALVVSPTFDADVAALRAGEITLIYETRGDDVVPARVRSLVSAFGDSLLADRLTASGLPASYLQTVDLRPVDVATPREVLGRLVGGFIPYLFLLFCFLGAMYPAIDLAAGEKERATLETLLTSPALRLELLVGKFGVVVLAGLGSALIAMLGLLVALSRTPDMPRELLTAFEGIVSARAVILELLLLVPLTMFFASVLLTLSVFAKSFKEAQSIVSPMSFFVIIPAALGMMPGLILSPITALIPILNVSLATKEIIAGTIDAGLLLVVFASLIALAAVGLLVCARYFTKEEVLFRT